ncbi:MAG: NAD(P)/FAD-dependent oxidoreductase [Acidimicrobiaceae bacterium]|nr:NAD(P)/FAD-dependent oxidoreductase [Acidimicrobiaceae bacterium]
MTRPRPTDDFEAIVVGAGHNGLVCAAYLARAGVDTLLIEARDEVGGCASTVSDLGARFNICSCDHALVRIMPLIEDLDLAAHGLRYLEADPSTIYLDHDGNPPWMFFNDPELTIESIGRHRPAQARAYRRYLQDAFAVAELTLEMANGHVSTPRMLARVLARRGRGGARLMQWSRASLLDVLSRYFDDEALIMGAVSNGPTVWGVSPSAPGTGVAAAQYAVRHLVKTGRPAGGSGALTDALAASFKAAGGELRCGSVVDGLITEAGRVRGVRLDDGSEIAASVVTAACDPVTVASQWLSSSSGAAARRFAERARAAPRGEGYQSKIDAVVSEAPSYRALQDSRLLDLFEGRDPAESNYVISPTAAELAESHRLLASGRIAKRPTLLANVPSVLDPSMLSSDGHHVLSLETLFTPYRLEGGWQHSSAPARWLEVWSSLLEPGYLKSVQRYRTMTPERYESEFFLPRGYTPSYRSSPLATLVGRRRELSRHRAPVPGLFMSGAGTFPGAGVWGASGSHTAKAVLRALR